MVDPDGVHHQLITHHDPTRSDWCAAECTCGDWSHEWTIKPDPITHLEQAPVQAEREWRRHLPVGEGV